MRIDSASRLSSFCGFGCLLLLLGTIEFAAVFVQAPTPNAVTETMERKLGIPHEHMEGLTENFMKLKARVTAEEKQIQLHYVSNEKEPNVENAKEVLVFIHGFPQNSYAWRHPLQHFRKKYNVIAVDMFNFGLSTKSKNPLDSTVEQYESDLREVLAHVKAMHPNAHINLITHDIGAAIASKMMYNKEAAKLVHRFVQINAPNPNSIADMKKHGKLDIKKLLTNPYFGKIMKFLLPGGILPWGENQANKKFLEELFFTDKNTKLEHPEGADTFNKEEDLKVYQKALEEKDDALAATNFWRAPLAKVGEHIKEKIQEKMEEQFEKIFDKIYMSNEKKHEKKHEQKVSPKVEEERVEKIEQPTMVVWGMKDHVFGPEFGEGALDACKQGVLVQLPKTSHWVPEDAPKTLNRLLERFVEGNMDTQFGTTIRENESANHGIEDAFGDPNSGANRVGGRIVVGTGPSARLKVNAFQNHQAPAFNHMSGVMQSKQQLALGTHRGPMMANHGGAFAGNSLHVMHV